MKIIKTIPEMRTLATSWQQNGKSVGFVPTMGALHDGHMSLVRRAQHENDVVVVSIFVNPLQFGPKEDFKKYPRRLKQDAGLLQRDKISVLFLPDTVSMYPPDSATVIRVSSLDAVLEGKHRPGHFEGVATVVAKLLNIVQPTRLYLGQKDYQQVRVLDRMLRDLNMPVHLVACPTIREKDGLAMSSRNRYLTPQQRDEALKIYQGLFLGRELVAQKIMARAAPLQKRLRQVFGTIPDCTVDYIAVVDPETLAPLDKIRRPALLAVAVRIGKTRLIDNVIIS